MPRYRLTLEFDATDDAEATVYERRARELFREVPHGAELLREGTRPWQSVTVVTSIRPPRRKLPKVRT